MGEKMTDKTADKFYNFLVEKADKIHEETCDTLRSERWYEAKAKEMLIGEIMREYEKVNGKPPSIE
jgi:hypothetical protein